MPPSQDCPQERTQLSSKAPTDGLPGLPLGSVSTPPRDSKRKKVSSLLLGQAIVGIKCIKYHLLDMGSQVAFVKLYTRCTLLTNSSVLGAVVDRADPAMVDPSVGEAFGVACHLSEACPLIASLSRAFSDCPFAVRWALPLAGQPWVCHDTNQLELSNGRNYLAGPGTMA